MPPLRLLKQSDLLQKSSNTMEVFQTSRDRSVVVEASAGTGKTFALEELVLELALVEKIPLQKILRNTPITFRLKPRKPFFKAKIDDLNLMEVWREEGRSNDPKGGEIIADLSQQLPGFQSSSR